LQNIHRFLSNQDGFGLIPKIRILSYHYIQNNGAFLFAYALQELLKSEFPGADVKIIDYKSIRLALFEYFKRFKLLPGVPLFYYRRARMWQEVQKKLDLDASLPRLSDQDGLLDYFSERYAALVVGMDVWCILNNTERPPFPNLYWLPGKMDIPKIAYGVSAYNSDADLIRRHTDQIGEYLDDFEVIGARDRFTYELVLEQRSRGDGLVERIPDPVFLYEPVDVSAAAKLASLGVDLSRPLVGLLLYGDDELSHNICAHYQARGCQVLAMSMYNRFTDFNLGHLLTPFEWAETFGRLSFCFSDRFHGTLMCIKSGIPFISLEKERQLPISQSKIYDLLTDFNLTTCYLNPEDEGFDITKLLAHADELEKTWEASFKPDILRAIKSKKDQHQEFVEKLKVQVGF
jgi:hypothetical protein